MMVGPRTFRDQRGDLRPEIQFATVLTVQRESPPIWYLNCAFLHQASDFIFPVSAWADWMADLVNAAKETLLPEHKHRQHYVDVWEHSIGIRLPLTAEEQMLMAPDEVIEYWQ